MTVLGLKYSPVEMCSMFVVTSLGISAALTKALVASSTCSITVCQFLCIAITNHFKTLIFSCLGMLSQGH